MSEMKPHLFACKSVILLLNSRGSDSIVPLFSEVQPTIEKNKTTVERGIPPDETRLGQHCLVRNREDFNF